MKKVSGLQEFHVLSVPLCPCRSPLSRLRPLGPVLRIARNDAQPTRPNCAVDQNSILYGKERLQLYHPRILSRRR